MNCLQTGKGTVYKAQLASIRQQKSSHEDNQSYGQMMITQGSILTHTNAFLHLVGSGDELPAFYDLLYMMWCCLTKVAPGYNMVLHWEAARV